MTNKRRVGSLGLTIPEIPAGAPNPRMSYDMITKWRDALPMADTGAAAKEIFQMLAEMSKSIIEPQERLRMLESIRSPVKTMSTTLKRHYVEQTEPLSPQKLKIAQLRETLMQAMSDNYKIILDDIITKKLDDKTMTATTICRILYYNSIILICRYQLYTYIPHGLWQEIYTLYKFAKQQNLLDLVVSDPASLNKGQTTPVASFTRIMLLYATDPYQWRQKDQHSLSKVIDLWAMYPNIHDHTDIPEDKTGVYIIDLDSDLPPTAVNFREGPLTASCVALNLKSQVEHIQETLNKINNNQLQAKIEHPNDPEFSVTIPALQKLIRIWSHKMVRSNSRFPLAAKVSITFGLTSAHYYLNNRVEFNPTPTNLHIDDQASIKSAAARQAVKELPTFEVEEEHDENAAANPDAVKIEPVAPPENFKKIAKDLLYKVYEYEVQNISPGGICLVVKDQSFPPFQAGEIVAFKNPMGEADSWSIGSLRWLKRNHQEQFLLGIELIAPFAHAGGMQVIRNTRPVGHLLRCLVLPAMPDLEKPSTIITPGIPLHADKVMLYVEGANGVTAKLTTEIEATGKYYQYEFTSADSLVVKKKTKEELQQAEQQQTQAQAHATQANNKKGESEFDSLWEDL